MTAARRPANARVRGIGVRRLLAVAAALTLSVVAVPDAGAGTDDTGASGAELAFQGRATMSQFPCPWNPDLCQGTLNGSVTGTLTGTDPGRWQVTLVDGARAHSDFQYLHAVDCMSSSAGGTLDITAGSGAVSGTYQPAGSGERHEVIGLDASVYMGWAQDATTLKVNFRDGTVRLNVRDIGWVEVMDGALGASPWQFVPRLDSEQVVRCPEYQEDPPSAVAEVAGPITVAEAG